MRKKEKRIEKQKKEFATRLKLPEPCLQLSMGGRATPKT
jgi:hypothetical protein